MLGTRRDITAHKEQEEQQRLAATVFEAASEGIAILDASFQLLAVNQAFCDVTGYGRAELIARNALELPCSRDARRHSQAIDQALEQQGAGRANWSKRARTASSTRSGCSSTACVMRAAASPTSSASIPIYRPAASQRSACATWRTTTI
jgi:PAS domain S-box-containing protein